MLQDIENKTVSAQTVKTANTAIGNAGQTMNARRIYGTNEISKDKEHEGEEILRSTAMDIDLSTFYGKKFKMVKLGSATKIANLLVWGVEQPKTLVFSALSYITKYVDWKIVLAEADLKAAQELVRLGKEMIKVMNVELKNANNISRSMMTSSARLKKMKGPTGAADRATARAINKEVKKQRAVMQKINGANRLGSLMAGVLYGTFAQYLKLRSYTAAAVKAIVSGTTAEGEDAYNPNDPDSITRKNRRIAARNMINNRPSVNKTMSPDNTAAPAPAKKPNVFKRIGNAMKQRRR